MTTDPDRAALDAAVLSWQAADACGDERGKAQARGRVLELMFETTSDRAVKMLWSDGLDRDDVAAVGVEVLVARVENYLRHYDPNKGSFPGYVFKHTGTWLKEARKRLRGETPDGDGFTDAEMRILTLYYGHRETFRAANGYYPSVADAAENIRAEQVEYTYQRMLEKSPEALEEDLRARAWRRVQQNGELAALDRLEDLVIGDQAAQLVSADALVEDSGRDGWGRIGTPAVAEEREEVPQWVALATLGMDGRVRRRAARLLTGAALEDERVEDKDILRAAHANLVNPVAQFVVLAGVENQVECSEPVRARSERDLLLASASL